MQLENVYVQHPLKFTGKSRTDKMSSGYAWNS